MLVDSLKKRCFLLNGVQECILLSPYDKDFEDAQKQRSAEEGLLLWLINKFEAYARGDIQEGTEIVLFGRNTMWVEGQAAEALDKYRNTLEIVDRWSSQEISDVKRNQTLWGKMEADAGLGTQEHCENPL